MHWTTRLITAFLLTVLSIVLVASVALAYLIVTPTGGNLLVHVFQKEFSSVGLVQVGSTKGSLQKGFVVKNVRIWGLSYLPGTTVRIQEVGVRLPLWDLAHTDVHVFNARISVPDSDPLIFTGDFYAGHIEGDLYGNSLDLHAVSRFLPAADSCPQAAVKSLSPRFDLGHDLLGFLSHIDVTIAGTPSYLNLHGHFLLDNVRYKAILITDGAATIDLSFPPDIHQCRTHGQLVIHSGTVKVRHTNLELGQSKMNFYGDALTPLMDIHLNSKVEDMDFDLTIKGSVINPQLTVTSDPPMPPQEALQVLFTGNALSTSSSPFNGITSGELAEDFLNYSLQDIGDQNMGVKTKLTNKLKLGVEMDQLPGPPGETNVYYSRKINGEMDLNNHMSLNVSQEVLPEDRVPYTSSSAQDASAGRETQVYWEYKKRF